MARLSRAEVFAADEVAIVHVINRTVRRCYLMGEDSLTGKNYDHRKSWMEDELQHLATFFGIDLLCYAILSNHFHLILRSRPEVVSTWNDAEVARRWLMLCPKRRDSNKQPLEPTAEELNMILNNPVAVREIRTRLSDISWWMRLLCQKIGRRANREDKEIGKFWQARYRAVRLLDEAAILACAAYVDLNPIRAALAETIETSPYTSAQQRVLELQAQTVLGRANAPRSSDEAPKLPVARPGLKPIARSLSPVCLTEDGSKTGPCVHQGGFRASDKGFLPLSTATYLELLDWTARQIRTDKRGSTPESAAPLFKRLGIDASSWCELTKNFGRLFSSVAGKPTVIDSIRSRQRKQRYNIPAKTRQLLSSEASK
ncbi:MAG: hypothetical protein JNL67_20625 [Planctomycetaceae bacterium]|nr:hypothetical protein [Planctomycetaceae bacterium]